jgi:sigma-B regulation protein RsbU (phosphoserine phosphatase)
MKDKVIPINLESLIDLSARLNETHDIKFILNVALLTLMGKLTISNGCVFYSNESGKGFGMLINKGRCNLDGEVDFDLNEFRQITGENDFEQILFDNGLLYLIPVIYQGELNAVFAIGKRLTEEPIGDTERHYINLVASITANSLEVAKEQNRLIAIKNELEFRNLTLTTLFEITNDFSSFLSGEQILKLLSYRVMGQLMINKFAIYRVGSSKTLELVLNRCDNEIHSGYYDRLMELDKTESRDSLSGTPLESLFAANDLEVISPMKVQGEIKGFLFIGKRMSGEKYSQENLSFIESLGNIAISAMENKRLFSEELEKKKLEGELALALDIQRGFLPSVLPELSNYELAGISEPSRHVAGDYFDFIKVDKDCLIIVMADVSGKGVAASLIMANIQAALKVLVDSNLSHLDIIKKLNEVVYQNTGADKFVTFFIGFLDLNNNKLEYINAGHNPPIIINSGKDIMRLEKGGLPLGIFVDEYDYDEGSYDIVPSDTIVFFTDGVTEAQNSRGKEFGEDRLIELLGKNLSMSSQVIINGIVEAVKDFSDSKNLYDDITVSVVKSKS